MECLLGFLLDITIVLACMIFQQKQRKASLIYSFST
uniref:Uncharacterized protein n=1 Tax=Arundo donax TaxID=35708 RepID=A0A0A8ZCG7_ARUDO